MLTRSVGTGRTEHQYELLPVQGYVSENTLVHVPMQARAFTGERPVECCDRCRRHAAVDGPRFLAGSRRRNLPVVRCCRRLAPRLVHAAQQRPSARLYLRITRSAS
jgi:hypothetical protein